MLSSHEGVPDPGSALNCWIICMPFCTSFFPSYTFNQSVFIKATIASTRHRWFSGRILIYQAGGPGSIPASTSVLFDIDEKMYVNDTCQKSLSYIGPDKKVLFV